MVAKAAGTAKDYRTVVAETTCGPGWGTGLSAFSSSSAVVKKETEPILLSLLLLNYSNLWHLLTT